MARVLFSEIILISLSLCISTEEKPPRINYSTRDPRLIRLNPNQNQVKCNGKGFQSHPERDPHKYIFCIKYPRTVNWIYYTYECPHGTVFDGIRKLCSLENENPEIATTTTTEIPTGSLCNTNRIKPRRALFYEYKGYDDNDDETRAETDYNEGEDEEDDGDDDSGC